MMNTMVSSTSSINELPQQVYDLLVDGLGQDVTVEDIWIEDRDEGRVCIVEVYSDPERAAHVLGDLEATYGSTGEIARFIVREPRMTRLRCASLSHPKSGKVETPLGPFHHEIGKPSLLLVSTPERELVPKSGWDATFRTFWDEITLHGATVKKSGNTIGLTSNSISVTHLRKP